MFVFSFWNRSSTYVILSSTNLFLTISSLSSPKMRTSRRRFARRRRATPSPAKPGLLALPLLQRLRAGSWPLGKWATRLANQRPSFRPRRPSTTILTSLRRLRSPLPPQMLPLLLPRARRASLNLPRPRRRLAWSFSPFLPSGVPSPGLLPPDRLLPTLQIS